MNKLFFAKNGHFGHLKIIRISSFLLWLLKFQVYTPLESMVFEVNMPKNSYSSEFFEGQTTLAWSNCHQIWYGSSLIHKLSSVKKFGNLPWVVLGLQIAKFKKKAFLGAFHTFKVVFDTLRHPWFEPNLSWC